MGYGDFGGATAGARYIVRALWSMSFLLSFRLPVVSVVGLHRCKVNR